MGHISHQGINEAYGSKYCINGFHGLKQDNDEYVQTII
jgi:hypothetical protein